MRLEVITVAILVLQACGPADKPDSYLIENVVVVDGSGSPGRTTAVRISGPLITVVGELSRLPAERVVDGKGLTLAPGFVDTHSHHDLGLDADPSALAAVSQGITTIVRGQDGFSGELAGTFTTVADFNERFKKGPAAVNVASYSAHNTIRQRVMGEDFSREASVTEVAAMVDLVEADMLAGALGISTGLEYDPGIYASTDELVTLARVAARHGGRYISHIRSEDRDFWTAIDEIIEIGRRAEIPVQISHLKLAARILWGQTDRLLAKLDEARAAGIDVTADLYPYEYWLSTVTVLFPKRNFADVEEARLVLDEIVPADGLIFVRYEAEPTLVGRNIAQIAADRGQDTAVILSELTVQADRFSRETKTQSEYVLGAACSTPTFRRCCNGRTATCARTAVLPASIPGGAAPTPGSCDSLCAKSRR